MRRDHGNQILDFIPRAVLKSVWRNEFRAPASVRAAIPTPETGEKLAETNRGEVQRVITAMNELGPYKCYGRAFGRIDAGPVQVERWAGPSRFQSCPQAANPLPFKPEGADPLRENMLWTLCAQRAPEPANGPLTPSLSRLEGQRGTFMGRAARLIHKPGGALPHQTRPAHRATHQSALASFTG